MIDGPIAIVRGAFKWPSWSEGGESSNVVKSLAYFVFRFFASFSASTVSLVLAGAQVQEKIERQGKLHEPNELQGAVNLCKRNLKSIESKPIGISRRNQEILAGETSLWGWELKTIWNLETWLARTFWPLGWFISFLQLPTSSKVCHERQLPGWSRSYFYRKFIKQLST